MTTYQSQEQKYRRQITSKYNFDYKVAQEYYKTLKNQMLGHLNKNLNKLYNKSIQSFERLTVDEILNSITQAQPQADDIKQSTHKLLERVESLVHNFINTLDSNDTGRHLASKQAGDVIVSMRKYQNEHPEAYKDGGEKRAFTNRYRNLMEKMGSTLFINLMEQVKNIGGGEITDTKMRTALETYAIRLFAKELTKNSSNPEVSKFFANMSKNSYVKLLSGLAYEAAMESAINQVYKKVNQSKKTKKKNQKIILQTGSDTNIKGQETQIDLLFNTLFNEKKTLEVFNREYLGTVQVDINEEIESILAGKPTSIIFGAQVKSFEALSGTFSGGLGHSASLRNNLLTDSTYGNGYSLPGNIAFMGQRNNIIQALGPRNVMFMDKKNKYWMDSFIEAFRQQDKYLMLKTKKEEKGKRWLATTEIALYNYTSAVSHRGG